MKTKSLLLYGLYVAAAVAVSLYLRFPSEIFRDYAVRKAESMVPGLSLAVAEVRPSLPAAVVFQGIEAGYRNMRVFDAEAVRISPEWISLLRLSPVWQVDTEFAGGRLRGAVPHPEGGLPAVDDFTAEFSDVQMGKIPILQELLGRRISGLCSGEIARTSPAQKGLEIQLRVSDARVELKQPLLQRENVTVKRLQAQAALSGRTLRLVQCDFRGPEFDGKLTGSVEVKSNFAESGIDLKGAIRPHTVFMAELKKVVPAQLLPGKGAGGEISFQLTGTLQNPRYSF